MKLSLLLTLAVAGLTSCSLFDPVDAPSAGTVKSGRKVAQATGGHGSQVANAASTAASRVTIERSSSISVFADEDPTSRTLRGKHRQVAGATGGHGSQVANAASAQAEPLGDNATAQAEKH